MIGDRTFNEAMDIAVDNGPETKSDESKETLERIHKTTNKPSFRREAMSTTSAFMHRNVQLKQELNGGMSDKMQAIQMGKTLGVYGIFVLFWGLMLLADVAVESHHQYDLDKKCAGVGFRGLLFLNVAWTFIFVIYIAYKRRVWNTHGWDVDDAMTDIALFAIVDFAFGLWFFWGKYRDLHLIFFVTPKMTLFLLRPSRQDAHVRPTTRFFSC